MSPMLSRSCSSNRRLTSSEDTPAPQGLCAGVIALVTLVTAVGKDQLISSCFFSSAIFAPDYSSTLTHLYIFLIKNKAEGTINHIKCWDITWLILWAAFSPVYQCFSFFCSVFDQFNEDSSRLFSDISVSWPGINAQQYKYKEQNHALFKIKQLSNFSILLKMLFLHSVVIHGY